MGLTTVGVFGGTFDPFHNGHMGLVKFALRSGIVDKVIIAPAGNPRLRESQPQSSFAHRYKMVSLAVKDMESVSVSKADAGSESNFLSVTSDLLTRLRDEYADLNYDWVLILGADAAIKMDKWINTEVVARLARVFVIGRPGYDWPGNLPKSHPGHSASYFEGPMGDVCAEEIREMMARGANTDGLVPRAVSEYIKREGLYQTRKLR